jgi:hypothetical protein
LTVHAAITCAALQDQFKPGVPVAPTLVITAHYDSFSIAPAAPAGADSSSSGAAACLLLLRMLHRLYASPESRPSRNVVVVLTAGGPYAQEGLRQWIRDLEPAQLEALEAAVVLDSIASSTAMQQSSTSAACSSSSSSNMGTIGRTIHMHHAGRAGDAHWLSAISDAAARMGVSVTPVEQGVKPDGQAAAAGFGHEHLAKKGIPAVTLSSLPCSPVTQLGGRVRVSSLGDVAAGVNMDSVLAAAQVRGGGTCLWALCTVILPSAQVTAEAAGSPRGAMMTGCSSHQGESVVTESVAATRGRVGRSFDLLLASIM